MKRDKVVAGGGRPSEEEEWASSPHTVQETVSGSERNMEDLNEMVQVE